MNDPIQFAKYVAEIVREQTARAVAPYVERLKALEDRPSPIVPEPIDQEILVARLRGYVAEDVRAAVADLPVPKDGESVSLEDVMAEIRPLLDEAVKAIPPPENGASVTLPEVLAAIEPGVQSRLAEIPLPEKGQDGASVTLPEVLAAIEPDVKAYLAAIPHPKDGEPGKSVTLDEVKGLLESQLAGWALDFERRAQDVLQRAIDRMPAPKDGKDGRDATSIDDIDLVLGEDGRTVTVRFLAGDEVREKAVRLATIIDRGTYKKEASYEVGDAVSWGGNLWVCQADTTESPDESRHGKPWRLAVRKGRDGREPARSNDGVKAAEPYRLRGDRT